MRLVSTFESREVINSVFAEGALLSDIKRPTSVSYLVYEPGEDNDAQIRARFAPIGDGRVEVTAFVDRNGSTSETKVLDGDTPASDALSYAQDLMWDAYLS